MKYKLLSSVYNNATLFHMKQVIITLIILIALGYAAYYVAEKHKTVSNPSREARCRDYVTNDITFSTTGAADIFLQRCIAGEPVLPEDTK